MTVEWFMAPFVAVAVIFGALLVARFERRGASRGAALIVVVVIFGVLVTALLIYPESVVAWLVGVLIGVGMSYAWIFHRHDIGRRGSQ